MEITMVDMGQIDARRACRNMRPFYTPDEQFEVNTIRRDPEFWDDEDYITERGRALVARLHEIKAIANSRYNAR